MLLFTVVFFDSLVYSTVVCGQGMSKFYQLYVELKLLLTCPVYHLWKSALIPTVESLSYLGRVLSKPEFWNQWLYLHISGWISYIQVA